MIDYFDLSFKYKTKLFYVRRSKDIEEIKRDQEKSGFKQ